MSDIKDELLRIAHEMRQEGQFEWARLIHFTHQKITGLEKELEDCRIINEMLSGGHKD